MAHYDKTKLPEFIKDELHRMQEAEFEDVGEEGMIFGDENYFRDHWTGQVHTDAAGRNWYQCFDPGYHCKDEWWFTLNTDDFQNSEKLVADTQEHPEKLYG